MIIKSCKGYELEKEKPNTSEDFFNRSEVVYVTDSGKQKALSVLYVRYFEELLDENSPLKNEILVDGSDSISIKDIVALVCLLNNSANASRKKMYIRTMEEFSNLFKGLDVDKLLKIFVQLRENKQIVL